MTRSNTPLDPSVLNSLDQMVRKVDEDRWLSSRYAAPAERRALIVLYAFCYELARVRLNVSEQTLGAIRFQWWRDALDAMPDQKAPEHETAQALQAVLADGQFHLASLHKLIDGYENAFEAQDRSLEPEARLAAMAARLFVPVHGWGEEMTELAPHWAALRRGEAVGYGPMVGRAPSAIRPAIGHFRLRRLYASSQKPNAVLKRLCVFRAMMGGHV